MRPVRIGVIGTGYGAKIALPVYRSLAEFEPVAIWSRRAARAAEVAAAAEIPFATDQVEELLALDGLEAVHVASPVAMHAATARAAAARGLHVLCEKPVARDMSEADDLAEAVSRAGVICSVNLARRFQTPRARLIEVTRALLGRPRFAIISLVHEDHATPSTRRFTWAHDAAQGGGRMQAYGAHDLDLVLQALGPVQSVAAALDVQVTQRRDGASQRTVSAEDTYALLLRLREGGLVTLSMAATAHHGRGDLIELYGDRGTVRLDSERRLWWGREGEDLRCEGPLKSDSAAAFGVVARNFHAAIRQGRPPFPSLLEGRQVQALIDAARLSARQRGWVEVEAVR
ncbi:MAG: Gfo/Idh/MocA family protein [Solirubrobacteraceae bacterium]